MAVTQVPRFFSFRTSAASKYSDTFQVGLGCRLISFPAQKFFFALGQRTFVAQNIQNSVVLTFCD
jgi:hypothetical protein